MEITLIPLLTDNYGYLLHDPSSSETAVVDPSEAGPGSGGGQARSLKIDFVLNTHHHPDHSGGNLGIKKETGCKVVGPAPDRERIPGIDIALDEGQTFELGNRQGRGAVHPRPHQGPHRLSFPRRPGGLLRRYPVLARLRAHVRRHAAA